MKKILFSFLFLFAIVANAQVGIGTTSPHASAQLDVVSTTKGFLPPRMNTTERNAINGGNPAIGLVIFNTTTNGLEFKTSTAWISLKASSDVAFLPSIVIGTQRWMGENLEVVTYRNGDIIPQVTDPTQWGGLATGAWCYYNNDPATGAIYGKLYNWYAVTDPRGLAPQGWHIPTHAEWSTLSTALGGESVAGGKMKKTGTLNWTSPNTNATNESSFSGLPGGFRASNGTSFEVGNYGYWWSDTEASTYNGFYRSMNSTDGAVRADYNYKTYGFSVRCLRD